jgi:hypothetical protein
MRENPVMPIIVGYTHTGKSTYIQELVSKRSRVLIVTPHPGEAAQYPDIDITQRKYFQYEGIRRVQATRDIIFELNREPDFFRNGVLVLDDAKFYVNNNVEKSLEQIFIARKQRGLDIIVAAHGLTVVPPIFFLYVSHFVMFKTQDVLKKRKNELMWYDQLEAMQKRINKHPDFHYKETFQTQI